MPDTDNTADGTPFFVLLGPDYAGKSSIMSELSRSMPGWQFVSTDEDLLAPAHELIAKLRRILVEETLPSLGSSFSPDFAISLMQTAVVHLRDRIAARGARPTLMDSYYYKTLAKCRMVIKNENPMFAWWRSFPQPRRVIYLDVPPGLAWRRSRFGARLNRLEHYGEQPCQGSFEDFQSDLRRVMHEEIWHLPVSFVPSRNSVAETAQAVREALSDECD